MRIKALVIGGIIASSAWAFSGAATAALSDCGSGRMCMWGNNDYMWKIGDRAAGEGDFKNLSGDKNDAMDSWANKSGSYIGCMYGSANGTGDEQTMAKNSNDNNVSPLNSDEVTSWRTRYGC